MVFSYKRSMIHGGGIETGSLHQGFDGMGAQIGRMQGRERALFAANGRADGIDDVGFRHGKSRLKKYARDRADA